MPEGPSILHLRNTLAPFIGKKVVKAGGYGKMPADWINGQVLKDIDVYGKYLYFIFAKGVVQLHLGLFGSIKINERKNVNRKFFLEFANGEINGYIVNTKQLASMAEAGVDERNDILSKKFDAKFVKAQILKKPQREIDDVLMDQDVFAGVGNKIRNESLYISGIHPLSIVEKIPEKKLDELIKAVRSYARKFYNNLEKKGTHKDFGVYKLDYDKDGSEVTMKVLPKTKRKIYFVETKQELYK